MVTSERGVFVGPLANRAWPWKRMLSLDAEPSVGLLVVAITGRERSICLRTSPAQMSDIRDIIAAVQSGWPATGLPASWPPAARALPAPGSNPGPSARQRPTIRLTPPPGP